MGNEINRTRPKSFFDLGWIEWFGSAGFILPDIAAMPSVTLGKKVSVNCTSATSSLLNTFYRSLDKDFAERHLVLGKKSCRRGVR
jgi:hypothetical protein